MRSELVEGSDHLEYLAARGETAPSQETINGRSPDLFQLCLRDFSVFRAFRQDRFAAPGNVARVVGIVGTFEQMAYRKVGCRTFTSECVTSAPSPLQRCEFGVRVVLVTSEYVFIFQLLAKL